MFFRYLIEFIRLSLTKQEFNFLGYFSGVIYLTTLKLVELEDTI